MTTCGHSSPLSRKGSVAQVYEFHFPRHTIVGLPSRNWGGLSGQAQLRPRYDAWTHESLSCSSIERLSNKVPRPLTAILPNLHE